MQRRQLRYQLHVVQQMWLWQRTFHCSGVLRQGSQADGGFIFDSMGRGVEQLKDDSNPSCLLASVYRIRFDRDANAITYPVASLCLGLLSDKLNHSHLHQLVHTSNRIKVV
jgi:hypothetical protein